MARFCFRVLIVAIFIVEIAISVDPPTVAPSPTPELESDPHSAHAPFSGTGAPASSPSDSPFSSPPAPSPDLGASPGSSPAPEPISSSVPVPAPSEREVSHSDVSADVNDAGSGGMSSGKKAGIAFGVIAAVGLVAGAGCLLKKRRDNERRAQYGFAARREIL